MTADRPDPDALLALAQAEEESAQRGKLKIFFGATAGVGKTYAMLEAAHELRRRGVDVVVGWVDTHGRKETEALLSGLEILPPRAVEHRGIVLKDFDLDAALARRPAVILVDELAHTNAPGSRHARRWQDVDELLAAGLDVRTAINVQHLESLNDLVGKITGVAVRETVPDSFFDRADQVELVDLPAEELIRRLEEGKVYVPDQAERAVQQFFRPGNLIALRELALRKTAERVDAQMQRYRQLHGIAETWPIAERILLAVSSGPDSARLVRAARRLAERLRAEWLVVYVETPAEVRLPQKDKDRVWQTLRLAEKLGAETAVLTGTAPGRGDPQVCPAAQRLQDRGGQAGPPALAGRPLRLGTGRPRTQQRRDRYLRHLGRRGGGMDRPGGLERPPADPRASLSLEPGRGRPVHWDLGPAVRGPGARQPGDGVPPRRGREPRHGWGEGRRCWPRSSPWPPSISSSSNRT